MKSKITFGILAFLFAVSFMAPAYAMGIDVPKPPKKDKKKEEKKDDAKKEDATKTEDLKKSDPAASDKPVDAKKEDTVAPAVATQDIKMPKSAWEKMGAAYKVGDWVEYEYPSTPGMSTRQEIIEVGDHFYVSLMTSNMAGQKFDSKSKMIFSEPDPKTEKVEETKTNFENKEFPDKVAVATKGDVAATRHEVYLDGKLASKSWMSTDVPITGIVKCEGPDGKVSMQLKGFGRK